MYIVLDSMGSFLRAFNSWEAAQTYRIANQRYDWQIVKR